jgi:hypothetical protein
MAFDNKTARGDAGEALRISREMGRTYLPPTSAPPSFKMLDCERQKALAAWAAALIPCEGDWPSAEDAGAAAYADNCAALSPVLRRALIAAIDEASRLAAERGCDFAELEPDAQVATLTTIDQEQSELFTLVLELVFEGYYRHPRVQRVIERRTGYEPAVAVSGIAQEPFDPATLDRVRELPRRVRSAPESSR